ncbi:MAG: hypothetical protein ACHQVS_03015, partial [Candidatus Babeliales bacterium]
VFILSLISAMPLCGSITTIARLSRAISKPWYRRPAPYAGIVTTGMVLAYTGSKKTNHAKKVDNKTASEKETSNNRQFKVSKKIRAAYKSFKQDTTQDYPKPLAGKFTASFTGTYPDNAGIITANHDVTSLGFPTSSCTKTYEKITPDMNNKQTTHTIYLSGHIRCNAGDNACNNALYALSMTPDFTQCMHMALSHPDIPRTQRCESLFNALGKYGPGDHVLREPLCKKAHWTFDVTLD